MLGPSGCGKTTTLRMIAGFEDPTEGRVARRQDVTGLPAFKRPTNTVFQSYALFPHLSVERNVAFGLSGARSPRTRCAGGWPRSSSGWASPGRRSASRASSRAASSSGSRSRARS